MIGFDENLKLGFSHKQLKKPIVEQLGIMKITMNEVTE